MVMYGFSQQIGKAGGPPAEEAGLQDLWAALGVMLAAAAFPFAAGNGIDANSFNLASWVLAETGGIDWAHRSTSDPPAAHSPIMPIAALGS